MLPELCITVVIGVSVTHEDWLLRCMSECSCCVDVMPHEKLTDGL